MTDRSVPFQSFLADAEMNILGICYVIGVFLAGSTWAERRQYAVLAWYTPSALSHSLAIGPSHRFAAPLPLKSQDLRFRNQTAELTRECFWHLQLRNPETLASSSSTDVPVLFAFSSVVADGVLEGSLPLLVLPPLGLQSLRLPTPRHTWEELQPLPGDLDFEDTLSDYDEDDGDGTQHRSPYRWPCPVHVCRLARHLQSLNSLMSVLKESAAVICGGEDGFLLSDGLSESCPGLKLL